MTMKSERLLHLPPFLFDEIDRKKKERIAAGADVINLGVGTPDQPTPEFIVEEMNRAMRLLSNQQYPTTGGGLKQFRESAARFMKSRFGVEIDPARHVLALLGSKDGISHLPWAVTNPGDVVLVPDPAYPVYEVGAVIASCKVWKMPVTVETGWKPDYAALAHDHHALAPGRERLLWTNYPGNPTAAHAGVDFYEQTLEFADSRRAASEAGNFPPDRTSDIIVCSDLAYSELYLDGEASKPVSLWQAENADINKTPAIEFHSLSKTFNMTGWRIGFAVGHPEIINALQAIKSNVDSGTFDAIQQASAVALDHYQHADIERLRTLYRQRRDAIVPGLREIGCEVEAPGAGFFVWARTPKTPDGTRHIDSMAFASCLLEEADTVVVPGGGFSPSANEWFRIALTVDAHRLEEVVRRIKKLAW